MYIDKVRTEAAIELRQLGIDVRIVDEQIRYTPSNGYMWDDQKQWLYLIPVHVFGLSEIWWRCGIYDSIVDPSYHMTRDLSVGTQRAIKSFQGLVQHFPLNWESNLDTDFALDIDFAYVSTLLCRIKSEEFFHFFSRITFERLISNGRTEAELDLHTSEIGLIREIAKLRGFSAKEINEAYERTRVAAEAVEVLT